MKRILGKGKREKAVAQFDMEKPIYVVCHFTLGRTWNYISRTTGAEINVLVEPVKIDMANEQIIVDDFLGEVNLSVDKCNIISVTKYY